MMVTDLSECYHMLSRLDYRLKLLFSLRERGYYVRMHAYEYIIGNGEELIAILIVDPIKEKIEVLRIPTFKGSLEGLIRTIRETYRGIQVEEYESH